MSSLIHNRTKKVGLFITSKKYEKYVQEHTIRVIFNELAAQCFLFHEKCTNVLDTIDQKNMSGFPLFKNIITDYFEVQNTK